MKNKALIILLAVCLCGCGKKEYLGNMEVISSCIQSSNDSYTENIKVIVNEEYVDNYESCAEEIIERCVKNDFKGTRFSYDVKGYPNTLTADVYLTAEDNEKGKTLFRLCYESECQEFNIKDNTEKYVLKIEESD